MGEFLSLSAMKQFSSTRAKQNFGELLSAAAVEPVAIEKHGKVQAIMAPPRFFEAARTDAGAMDARRLARLSQTVADKNRLIRHQRIAFDLVTAPAVVRKKMVAQAKDVVDRWRRENLCSLDYVDRWSAILRLPAREIALQMTSDGNAWGPALRQNSPWVGLHA